MVLYCCCFVSIDFLVFDLVVVVVVSLVLIWGCCCSVGVNLWLFCCCCIVSITNLVIVVFADSLLIIHLLSLSTYPYQTHPDGTYLIRESTYFPGDYTLCLLFEKKVEHYHILCKESRLTIDEEVFFENLSQLVRVRFIHFFAKK